MLSSYSPVPSIYAGFKHVTAQMLQAMEFIQGQCL